MPTAEPTATPKSPAKRPYVAAVAACTLLIGVAVYLLTLPYLPFQDVPNHILAALVHDAGPSAVYEPGELVFTYGLSVWLLQAVSVVFSAGASVALLVVIASVATPLMVGAVAARLDLPRWPCVLAGMPLIVAYPTKMGFVQFILAVPFCVWSIALAIDVVRAPSLKRQALFSFAMTLGYLAHALAVIPAVLCILAGWLFLGGDTNRWRALARLACCSLPVLPLAAWDFFGGALGMTPGVEVNWTGWDFHTSDLSYATQALLPFTLGIQRPSDLPLHYAYLFVVVASVLWIIFRHRDGDRRRWMAVTVGLVLGSMLLLPARSGMLNLLTERFYVYLLCIGAIAACDAARALHPRGTWIVTGAAALSLFASLHELKDESERLDQMMSGLALHSVREKTMPVRVDRCGAYPLWDPVRQAWAYALAPEAPTPYLFAFNRYHAFRYRGDYYRRELVARTEASNGSFRPREDCDLVYVDLVLEALNKWPGYTYLLLYGDPEAIKATLRTIGMRGQALAPGMYLLEPKSPTR